MKRTISGSIAKLACSAFAAAFLFVLPVSAKEATVQNGDIQAALDQAKGSSEAVTVTIPTVLRWTEVLIPEQPSRLSLRVLPMLLSGIVIWVVTQKVLLTSPAATMF